MRKHASGSIIVLNGPSSVGKTTLTRCLQEQLHRPFLRLAVDQLIGMMPNQLNKWDHPFPSTASPADMPEGFCFQVEESGDGQAELRLHFGPFGQRIADSLPVLAVALRALDFDLIIDTVMLSPEKFTHLLQVLGSNSKILTVGLTAPIDVLEARELLRGDRTPGSARWQATRVHVDNRYDLTFDTSVQSIEEIAAEIILAWNAKVLNS